MRVSRRTQRVVRLVVPWLRVGWGHAAIIQTTGEDRRIAREVIRRDLARRARADIRTYWATMARDGEQ